MFVPKVNLEKALSRRWAQPDRRFFACGACHLLALAHIDEFPGSGYRPYWIRPVAGFTGNHIFVADGKRAFDYHGYSNVASLLRHYAKRGERYYPGWDAAIVPIEAGELLGGGHRDGLYLLPPEGFLKDPMPRAKEFLARFLHNSEQGPPNKALNPT